jgi:hypothetical protein
MKDTDIKILDKLISDRFYSQQNQESEDESLVRIALHLSLPSAHDMLFSFTYTYKRKPEL